MRPLRLVLRAYGCYGREECVDFAKLRERGLFLISGPTGAGKTTLLDAICWALYGESSGGRAAADVASHFAAVGEPTEVTFDFALGGRRLRVRRRWDPAGDGACRVPGGESGGAGTAWLWDRTGSSADGDGRLLVSGSLEVTAAVGAELGLSGDQFKAVAVLPQGEAVRLLAAAPGEREELLHALFRTARYRGVEAELVRRRSESEAALAERRARRAALLERAEAAGAADLDVRLAGLEREAVRAEARVRERDRRFVEADEALRSAEATAERFGEARAARTACEELTRERGRIAVRRQELERAERAARLDEAWEGASERRREAERLAKRAAECARAIEEARVDRDRAAAAREAERGREAERRATAEEVAQLRDKVAKTVELKRARTALAGAHERRTALAREVDAARAGADQARAGMAGVEAGKVRAREAVLSLQGLALRFDEVNRRIFARRSLDRVEAAVRLASRTAKAGERACEEAEARLRNARADLEAAIRLWIHGRAVELARTLAAGDPCPVCGSCEHPAPAAGAEGGAAGMAVETRRAAVADAEAEAEAARARAEEGRARLARLEAEAARFAQDLGAQAEPLAALEQQAREAQKAVEAANTGRRAVLAMESQVAEARDRLVAAEAEAVRRELAQERLVVECGRLLGVVETFEREVPEALRDVDALDRAIAAAEGRLRALAEALAAAEAQQVRAERRIALREGEQGALVEQHARAEAGWQEAQAAFVAKLAGAGFDGADGFAAARRPAQAREMLRQVVEDFDRSLAEAERRVRAAEAGIAGRTEPDLEVLRSAWQAAREAKEAAIREEEAILGRRDELSRVREEVGELDRSAAELEARRQRLARLAAAAAGDNRLGMTFRGFALAARLEEATAAASARLGALTGGRYRFAPAAGAGGAHDLRVLDAHTGEARAVRTLSGGESFLAALAFSLGLSDVVRRRAGGVPIDSVFVDEGFGALDHDALETAMRALAELGERGGLVGVISHVPLLREWIGARLRVTPGPDGSRALWE